MQLIATGEYSDIIVSLVAHQHTSLYSIVVEGITQTAGSNRCPTSPFTGVHNQNVHGTNIDLWIFDLAILNIFGYLLSLLGSFLSFFL